jgi:hypothetical protein
MSSTIESADQFKDTPQGYAERWQAEMAAADKESEKWHKEGQRLVDRFLDKRKGQQTNAVRLNLFNSNVTTMRDMLYGQMPSVEVKRRYDDFNDDAARVAGTIMQRLLNNDMQRDEDSYTDILRYALEDRLIPGLGCARVRYEADFEEEEVPPVEQMGPDGQPIMLAEGYTEERKVWEDAIVDYVNWRDVRWSPARVWSEVRWVAFAAYLTKDQMEARFGKQIAESVPYSEDKSKRAGRVDAMDYDAWQRCRVWEIWCEDERKVYWWVKGFSRVLDVKDDPLELSGFFPCPKFLIANPTTSSLIPTPDFHMAKDLYNEIDFVSTRIERLERAVKAVGVYDKAATGVQRMLQEGTDNDLIPVDNWAVFGERGGLQGTVQWMPLADIVGAMDKLREYRKELIDLLHQVTGMSDILRGATTQPNVTATEQGLKARFASVRITALQDAFADFASQLQQLRAEIISKHFDDETIIQRSNILTSPDAPLVGQALQLLRSEFASYRIEIEPDNIARADYAALKNDRVELITAIGQFIGQALPLAQQTPAAGPALIEMVKWAATGFRGGAQIETVLDQMLTQIQQQQGQGQGQEGPSPEVQAEQAKQQAKMAEINAKAQADMREIQMKMQGDMQKLQVEHQNKMAQIQAELQADIMREQKQAEYNALEEQAKSQAKAAEMQQRARLGGQP